MAGKVLTIASGKGGVGKTVSIVNLAVGLRMQDQSVVLVDGDLGMPNIAKWFGADREPTLHDVLAGTTSLHAAVRQEADGFAVLPGDTEIDGFADADPSQFAYAVDRLAQQYEYVLIDTGGGLSYENALPLEIADEILLVTSPDPSAISDTKRTKGLIDLIEGTIRGVIITKASAEVEPATIAEQLDAYVYGLVPFDETVEESVVNCQPLEVYAPETDAASAYRSITAKLLEEEAIRTTPTP